MRLLKINDSSEELDQFFDDSEELDLEDAVPEVIDREPDVRVNGESADAFDMVYARIPVKNAIFGRVLLEMIEEKGINLNYSSTAFFTMAKKNYLYHVLHQKGVPAPKTSVVADEKSARNLQNHLKGPLVARRFSEYEEVEKTKIQTVEEIRGFVEGLEYGDGIIVFNELKKGEKYRCLYADGEVVSLQDGTEGWKVAEDSLGYSNLPSELEETVRKAVDSIGTGTCEIILRSGEVVDVNPNPDLEMYRDLSGKDVYKLVADTLKGDEK